MKRLLIIMAALVLISCIGVKNAIPPGKTVENDWEKDWKFCQAKAGNITGILAPTTFGFIENKINGADDRYMQCMKELGWYK